MRRAQGAVLSAVPPAGGAAHRAAVLGSSDRPLAVAGAAHGRLRRPGPRRLELHRARGDRARPRRLRRRARSRVGRPVADHAAEGGRVRRRGRGVAAGRGEVGAVNTLVRTARGRVVGRQHRRARYDAGAAGGGRGGRRRDVGARARPRLRCHRALGRRVAGRARRPAGHLRGARRRTRGNRCAGARSAAWACRSAGWASCRRCCRRCRWWCRRCRVVPRRPASSATPRDLAGRVLLDVVYAGLAHPAGAGVRARRADGSCRGSRCCCTRQRGRWSS